MSIVAFSLGYQSALFAAPRKSGIDVLLNDYSQRQTPVYVAYTDKQRYQGESARQKYVNSFRNTIAGLTPLLGRKYKDADVQEELKNNVFFQHTELPNGRVGINVSSNGEEKTFSVEQILGTFLNKLKDCAEKELSTKVTDCVIGVPAWYNDEQRSVMLDAAKIAGLNCVSLFSETTAVALNYGIYKQDLPEEKDPPRRVVFVDFGHSQLQMSAVEFVKGKLTVLGTACDRTLGGRNFDKLLLTHFAKDFGTRFKLDILSNKRATIRLESACENLKKLMSSNTQALPLSIECLMDDKDVNGRMSREEFDVLCADLLQRVEATALTLKGLLDELKVPLDSLYAVEVVGGSSRIPAVRNILSRVFGKELSTTLNTDEAVVRGLALKGAMISPTFRVREFAIVDKAPYAIQMAWKKEEKDEEGGVEVYNETSPVHISKIFTFYRSSPFELQVSYKSPRVPGGDLTIGKFQIQGVKPSFDGEAQKIKVKVRINEFGVFVIDSATMSDKLQVEASAEADVKAMETDDAKEDEKKEGDAAAKDEKKDEKKDDKDDKKDVKKKKTHQSVNLTVVSQKTYVRSTDELNSLVEEELKMLAQDKHEIEKAFARNSLEEYIYDMRDKLSSIYEEFIKPEDREKFSSALQDAESWLYRDDEDPPKHEYVDRLNGLKTTGNPVAARYSESQERPAAKEALERAIVRFRKFVEEYEAGKEDYVHIAKDQVEKVKKEVETKSTWLTQKLTEQDKLPKFEPPAVLTAVLVSKREELERACNNIVNTPKPKVEPPKDTPKPADAAAAGAGAAPAADGAAGAAPAEGGAAAAAEGDKAEAKADAPKETSAMDLD